MQIKVTRDIYYPFHATFRRLQYVSILTCEPKTHTKTDRKLLKLSIYIYLEKAANLIKNWSQIITLSEKSI